MNLWDKIKSTFSAPEPDPAIEVQPVSPTTTKHTRTDHEKSLILEFKTNHATLLEKLEDAIYDTNLRMKKEEDIFEKVELCRKTISAYEKLQTVCIKAGLGGSLYFEDMWEHCSNSTNSDFRFIDPVEETMYALME